MPMKHLYKILFLSIVFTTTFSCSTKKDTVIARKYHVLTTKYNVLFNGNEAFDKGIATINTQFKDNYWKQLPIEPIKFDERKLTTTFSGPGGGFNTQNDTKKELSSFDKAEEKAVKAVQMHSMNIGGREKNTQIDEAYLLLGKSRYYSQRFIPAIEAFNYIIANYPYASLIGETKIWRAKANIRIDNEELAIESLKLLLEIREGQEYFLSKSVKEQAHTALAMAYVKTDSLQKAIQQLTKATKTDYNKVQSARNLFVLGQMYSGQNKRDSAVFVFQKLSAFKKAPYKYRIHAQIELAKNFSKDSSSTVLIKRLKKGVKNHDNKQYLGELQYQIGVLEENKDSISLAIKHYNKSLQADNVGDQQKSLSYERLGNLYFKQSDYIVASSYYDSVLQVSEKFEDLRVRRVKRRYKNLASLIKYETVLVTNDSILSIASMPIDAQKLYFEKHIRKLKTADKERAQQQLNELAFGGSFGGSSLQSNKKGKWYFYNTQVMNFGTAEFQKIWGNRPLEDNWRWAATTVKSATDKEIVNAATAVQKYDIKSYLASVPTDTKTIDSLTNQRNKALYELGVIYKEQFKNLPLSIARLERLLSTNKDTNLLLPIHYHLYQIYGILKDKNKEAIHKKTILKDYSKSPFAHAIQFPNKEFVTEKTVDEIAKTYKEMYYLYKADKFEEVVVKIDEILPKIQNSKIIPKFELLKAYAIGKYYDAKTYKRVMNFVAIKYPNTAQGKKAKLIVERIK